jgi:hypothetical protein
VAIADYNLKALLAGSPRLAKSLNEVALDARWWVGIAMVSFLIISISPYIEQRRWPYTPTAELQSQFEDTKRQLQEARERAKPLFPPGQPVISGLQAAKELENIRSEVDELKRQNEVLRQQQTPVSAPAKVQPKPTLSAEDIATKIEIWRSLVQQMEEFSSILTGGYSMIDVCATVAQNDCLKLANDFSGRVYKFRLRLEGLHDVYTNYKDIEERLRPAKRSPGSGGNTIFDQLSHSIDAFVQEEAYSQSSPNLIPHIRALRRDLDTLNNWQATTRQLAEDQTRELAQMGTK